MFLCESVLVTPLTAGTVPVHARPQGRGRGGKGLRGRMRVGAGGVWLCGGNREGANFYHVKQPRDRMLFSSRVIMPFMRS